MTRFPGTSRIKAGEVVRTTYLSDPHVTALLIRPGSEYQSVLTLNPSATEQLAADELAIRDYAENTGVYDALVAAGIVYPAHRFIRQGFVERVPVVRLVDASALRELPR